MYLYSNLALKGKAEGQLKVGWLLDGTEIGLPTLGWENYGRFEGWSLGRVGFEEGMASDRGKAGGQLRVLPPSLLFCVGEEVGGWQDRDGEQKERVKGYRQNNRERLMTRDRKRKSDEVGKQKKKRWRERASHSCKFLAGPHFLSCILISFISITLGDFSR